MEKNRLEAFSDGVLAIIITIMILELKVPRSADWEVLRELVPQLLGYVLSFSFIGIYWVNHHHLLQMVRHVNSALLWANLNLLFWLSLIPFATGWMGENHFATHPVVAYAILLLASGLSFTVLQTLITREHHYDGELYAGIVKLKRKGYLSTLCYVLSIPAAYWDTRISCGLFLFVSVMWLIPERSIEHALNDK
jgi:uncharacterized membrane protein